MKKKIEIEIDVPDGKKAVWKDGKVVFEDIVSGLPRTWMEFCDGHPLTADEYYIGETCGIVQFYSDEEFTGRGFITDANWLPSEQAAMQHLALMQLHQLRDCYRQGWVPDWESREVKYCVSNCSNGYDVEYSETAPFFLAFQSKEIAEEFLRNFRDLIEQAGDLI